MWKMELADQKRTGMILGSIYTLRDLGLSEEYILQNIMQRFHLEEEEAKEYLLPPEQREDWEEENGLYIL